MHCKRCGKAIGTDRGICPFCGAMLTSSQMNTYIADKKEEEQKKVVLLTEKYGEKTVIYETNKESSKLWIVLVGLLFLFILAMIILAIILAV